VLSDYFNVKSYELTDQGYRLNNKVKTIHLIAVKMEIENQRDSIKQAVSLISHYEVSLAYA